MATFDAASLAVWLRQPPLARASRSAADPRQAADVVGPWEMVTMGRQVADGPEACLIVAQTLEPVVCAKGLSTRAHRSTISSFPGAREPDQR